MLPGDLVYYDKCGGNGQLSFPFSEESARGIAMIVSEVMSYEYEDDVIRWVWVINEKGEKMDFSIDYLEPIAT